LFDKGNLKILLIWINSVLLTLGFKLFSVSFVEPLVINNEVLLALVFGPAIVVTILLVSNKLSKI